MGSRYYSAMHPPGNGISEGTKSKPKQIFCCASRLRYPYRCDQLFFIVTVTQMLPFCGNQDTGNTERLGIHFNFVRLWSNISKLSCISKSREHGTSTMLQKLGNVF